MCGTEACERAECYRLVPRSRFGSDLRSWHRLSTDYGLLDHVGSSCRRQKSGSIINLSTALVDQPIAAVGAAVQIMLKGALNAVTRALAIEYPKQGFE
jgi:NAD(P)-dependent dehydrogenase (short-subunit alcohol dehydrogenase family)